MATKANFNATTSGDEVVQAFADQVNGRTFVITGASSESLGAETAVSLCRKAKPAQLILLSRDESRVAPVIKQIQTLNSSVKTFFFPIDLTDAASIRSAVERLLSHPEIKNIDVLINNAGVMGVPYTPIDAFKDEKGASVELHFAANHLGPFLLTVLLMQRIRNSGPGARIVNVSAGAYIFSEVKFDDLNFSNGNQYDSWKAYAQSKTANILMTKSIASRIPSHEVAALTLHPGIIPTGLGRHLNIGKPESSGFPKAAAPKPMFNKTRQQGCSTILVAALDPGLEAHSGSYLNDCQIQNVAGFAADPQIAERLWRLSQGMLNVEATF